MQLKPIPLFTPFRMAVSVLAGGCLSWCLHAGIHEAWLQTPGAQDGDTARTAHLAQWMVTAYSLIMTVSACWLVLVLLNLWRRSGRDGATKAPTGKTS